MNELLLASRNRGKIEEISEILKGLPITIKSLFDYPDLPEIVEDGNTLEENALKKARQVFGIIGKPVLADDTGLEVYCLDMAPGVMSARYAGEHVSYEDNNRKLLNELADLPVEKRGARFRCIAAFVSQDLEKISEGICEGEIIRSYRGTQGFGYDPIFLPRGLKTTFAEMSVGEKNRISHRSKAFYQMRSFLTGYFQP